VGEICKVRLAGDIRKLRASGTARRKCATQQRAGGKKNILDDPGVPLWGVRSRRSRIEGISKKKLGDRGAEREGKLTRLLKGILLKRP